MCSCLMVGISQQDDRWWLELTVDSVTMSKTRAVSGADRSTLIIAQLSALNVATERGTSDMTEATRFTQCVHDQQRRLEAEAASAVPN